MKRRKIQTPQADELSEKRYLREAREQHMPKSYASLLQVLGEGAEFRPDTVPSNLLQLIDCYAQPVVQSVSVPLRYAEALRASTTVRELDGLLATRAHVLYTAGIEAEVVLDLVRVAARHEDRPVRWGSLLGTCESARARRLAAEIGSTETPGTGRERESKTSGRKNTQGRPTMTTKSEKRTTPGPWTATKHTDFGEQIFIHGGDQGGVLIAEMNHNPRHKSLAPESVDADVQLIAAAPDLLAACEEALEVLSKVDATSLLLVGLADARKTLREAIARARGTS